MASLEYENSASEDENRLKNARNALDVFILAKNLDALENDLNDFDLEDLREVGSQYYNNNIKERNRAVTFIEYFQDKNTQHYPNINSTLGGMREARQHFKNTNLDSTLFNYDAELDDLRGNLWFSFAGKFGTNESNKLANESLEIFDKLTLHASHHLFTTMPKSDRENIRELKYNSLITLFQDIKNSDDASKVIRLTQVRDFIKAALDENPDTSDLIKNRGGFFGAYKTLSRVLNAVGCEHFSYGDRTAVSTTDHLLITLYDKISEHLNHLRDEKGLPAENSENQVEILDSVSI